MREKRPRSASEMLMGSAVTGMVSRTAPRMAESPDRQPGRSDPDVPWHKTRAVASQYRWREGRHRQGSKAFP
jgi:hypothetical protein